jgi:hypothetical protein
MSILFLSALILITLNLKSQTIQVSDLDSAIIRADRLIETNPGAFSFASPIGSNNIAGGESFSSLHQYKFLN